MLNRVQFYLMNTGVAGGAPTTFAEWFGADLAHLWDSYDDGTTEYTDSVGGYDVTADDDEPAEAIINGHHYPVFDGNDTGLKNATNFTTLDGLEDFCVFGAFKTNNGSAFGAIIDKNLTLYVEFAGSVMNCSINSGGAGSGEVLGVTVVDDDEWHRFILTCTAGELKLYVDGSLEDSDTGVLVDTNVDGLLIGEQPNSTVTDSAIAVVGIATRGVNITEVGQLDDIIAEWVEESGAPPTISAVGLDQGDTLGGELIAVIGTNLDTVTAVTVHGTPATAFLWSSPFLWVLAPPNAAGLGDISVTNPDGSDTASNSFRVWDPTVEADIETVLERGDYEEELSDGLRWTARVGTTDLQQSDGNDGANTPLDDQCKEPRCIEADLRTLHDNSNTLNSYLGGAANTEGTMAIGFRTPNAGAAGADAHQDPEPLIHEQGGGVEFATGFSDDGVSAAFYDNGVPAWKTVRAACAVDNQNTAIVRWDSDDFEIRANGGSWDTDTRVGATNFSITHYWGADYNGAVYGSASFRFAVFASTKWDDTLCGRLDKWARNRHGAKNGSAPEIWYVDSDVLPLAPKQVTIKGDNLTGTTVVLFANASGIAAATSVSVVDDNTITCVPPALSAGAATLLLYNGDVGQLVDAVEYYDVLGRAAELRVRVGDTGSRTDDGTYISLLENTGTADGGSRDWDGGGTLGTGMGGVDDPELFEADADFGGEDSAGATDGIARAFIGGTYATEIAQPATAYHVFWLGAADANARWMPLNIAGAATDCFAYYGPDDATSGLTVEMGVGPSIAISPGNTANAAHVGCAAYDNTDSYGTIDKWLRVAHGSVGTAVGEESCGYGNYNAQIADWKTTIRIVVSGRDDHITRRKMMRALENFYQVAAVGA